jgi:nitric oxide reductase large subunit
MQKMSAFFFWASWACITNRPGANVTYTNNWPPDEIIGNKPTNSLISAEFMQQPILQFFRWLRVIGDTVFALGYCAGNICYWFKNRFIG